MPYIFPNKNCIFQLNRKDSFDAFETLQIDRLDYANRGKMFNFCVSDHRDLTKNVCRKHLFDILPFDRVWWYKETLWSLTLRRIERDLLYFDWKEEYVE